MNNLRLRLLGLFFGVVVAFFCTISWAQGADYLDDASYEQPAANAQVADPLEPLNRVLFTVNDKMYVWVVEPVSTGYSKVLPVGVRKSIGNFFYNLGEPVRSVNCLLQGRIRDAGLTLGRFAMNSVCGILGLADAADSAFQIKPIYASLGETFSTWGVGDGFYLVVPVIGPSTLRDLAGTVGDGFAMETYTPWSDDALTFVTVHGGRTVNYTSLHLGEYAEVKSLSFDPYVAFRNGYFQIRAKRFNHTRQYE